MATIYKLAAADEDSKKTLAEIGQVADQLQALEDHRAPNGAVYVSRRRDLVARQQRLLQVFELQVARVKKIRKELKKRPYIEVRDQNDIDIVVNLLISHGYHGKVTLAPNLRAEERHTNLLQIINNHENVHLVGTSGGR